MSDPQNIDIDSLINNYYPSLYATAIRFVKSPDIAQDIVQEVIIKFLNKKKNEIIMKTLDDLLFIMVRNESLNYLRGIQNSTKRYKKVYTEESEDPIIWNILLEEETNNILISAINRLPEQCARVIHLTLLEYENREIAELLAISIHTVKSLKYTAIRKLRKYFIDNKDLF